MVPLHRRQGNETATGALSPKAAVTIAGVLNLVGAFLSVQVALTISSGLVDETRINPIVIFAGLIGAILWNLLTWLLGPPSSSSHALAAAAGHGRERERRACTGSTHDQRPP